MEIAGRLRRPLHAAREGRLIPRKDGRPAAGLVDAAQASPRPGPRRKADGRHPQGRPETRRRRARDARAASGVAGGTKRRMGAGARLSPLTSAAGAAPPPREISRAPPEAAVAPGAEKRSRLHVGSRRRGQAPGLRLARVLGRPPLDRMIAVDGETMVGGEVRPMPLRAAETERRRAGDALPSGAAPDRRRDRRHHRRPP